MEVTAWETLDIHVVHVHVWYDSSKLFAAQLFVKVGNGLCGQGLFPVENWRRADLFIEFRGSVSKVERDRLGKVYTSRGWENEYMLSIHDKTDVTDATVYGNRARNMN